MYDIATRLSDAGRRAAAHQEYRPIDVLAGHPVDVSGVGHPRVVIEVEGKKCVACPLGLALYQMGCYAPEPYRPRASPWDEVDAELSLVPLPEDAADALVGKDATDRFDVRTEAESFVVAWDNGDIVDLAAALGV